MRRGAGAAGWAWFTTALVLLLLRWADLSGPVPMLQSVLPLVGLSVALLAVLALLLRARVLALCAGLLDAPGGASLPARDVLDG